MDSHMTKLLTIDANPKTVKGNAQGYMTAILHLAPANASGYQVCAMAEMAQCKDPCLNVSGHGAIAKGGATFSTPAGDLPDNAVQKARIRRTRFFFEDREGFMRQLHKEISAFVRSAARKGLTPTVRLNGTSDIAWERVALPRDLFPIAQGWGFDGIQLDTAKPDYPSIFNAFPDVQFYDYTKHPKRALQAMPANYHLSLSYSGASQRFADLTLSAHAKGAPLVVVVRDNALKAQLLDLAPHAIDGDETDLRFLDAPGSLVVLYAKGKAKKDDSGFVVDDVHALAETVQRAGSLLPLLAA
ncbi:MAG: hypothetical protein EB075_10840 [Bacteroidetes bacterium]|nr:hypothetical protein [Bacteroidota bacterium]